MRGLASPVFGSLISVAASNDLGSLATGRPPDSEALQWPPTRTVAWRILRVVLTGQRSSLKRSVVSRVRAALARSGPVGHRRIEPYETHGERNAAVEGTQCPAHWGGLCESTCCLRELDSQVRRVGGRS